MLDAAMSGLERLLSSLRLCKIVRPYEAGLLSRAGRDIRTLGPGIYWVWPVIDEIQKFSIVAQINRLPPQSLTTRDGKSLLVSGVVEYDVTNIKLALRAIDDVDEAINDRATKLIAQMISERTYQQCASRSDLEGEIEDTLQDAADAWGLRILSFGFTNFAMHRVLRVVGQDTQATIARNA